MNIDARGLFVKCDPVRDERPAPIGRRVGARASVGRPRELLRRSNSSRERSARRYRPSRIPLVGAFYWQFENVNLQFCTIFFFTLRAITAFLLIIEFYTFGTI